MLQIYFLMVSMNRFLFLLSIFFLNLFTTNFISSEENEEKIEECKEDKKEETKSENGDSEGGSEKEDKPEEGPPPIGNFALPASQQPAGLFAFGGNIIDKGEIQIYLFVDEFVGRNKKLITDVLPGVLFGVTDELSLFFNTPFTPIMRDDGHTSSGLEDFFIQAEYAFYNKKNFCFADQATLVANITFPTGSVKKNPPTGFGAPSFFLGATFYHMLVDWFAFTSHGAILTTSDHRTKIGNQFLYQFGIGRNIPSPEGWIYAWMLELDGQYFQKNRIRGYIDKNSGGNTIFVTPSLWVSSRDILLQCGVTLPISQNLFGHQNKIDYSLIAQFAWSIY